MISKERAEYMKEYRIKNKSKIKETSKEYRNRNKEKVRSCSAAWDKANPDRVARRQKDYMLRLNLRNQKISRRTLRAWAIQVKERDCYICQKCGSTEQLEAHHILPKSIYPDNALETTNGITLCNECHSDFHSTTNR